MAPPTYFFKIHLVGRFVPLVGVISRLVESPLKSRYNHTKRLLRQVDLLLCLPRTHWGNLRLTTGVGPAAYQPIIILLYMLCVGYNV